jgi:hypothetical protein
MRLHPSTKFRDWAGELATTEILPRLRATIDGAIEVARAESVSEILLLTSREHSWLIESITKKLSALPIQIYLLPDENVARYLGRRATARHTLLNRPAARISGLADRLTNLAQLAEVVRFRYCERPHKSARASTCNDAASGNKIQSFVFHNLSIRNSWHPQYCSAIEPA